MWWLILYVIPLFICILGCLWMIKQEGKTTRRDLLFMMLVFVPLINAFAAVCLVIEAFKSKPFNDWLDVAVVDHTKEEPPK